MSFPKKPVPRDERRKQLLQYISLSTFEVSCPEGGSAIRVGHGVLSLYPSSGFPLLSFRCSVVGGAPRAQVLFGNLAPNILFPSAPERG